MLSPVFEPTPKRLGPCGASQAMQARTKHLILGAIVGTFMYGLGHGTIIGAAKAAQEFDRRNGLPPFDDDNGQGDMDVP